MPVQPAVRFVRSALPAVTALAILASTAIAAPIGRWSFNESSGTTAANSVAGANGILTNNVNFAPGGISGNCVNFPVYGGGFVTMGNTYNIDTNPEFSISIWAKTTNTANPLFPVSRHFTGITNGYMIGINSLGGTYTNPLRPSFYLNDQPPNMCRGTTIVTDGQWHHLVAVYRFIGTGYIREIWVDGVREAANGFVGPNSHPTPSFMIGGVYFSSGGEAGVYQGQVDEVQLYNYAITAADINSLHNAPTSIAGPKQCFCDLNGDAQINTADLVIFLARFAQPTTLGALGDINYDASVNTQDLTIFLGRFGQPCN